MKPASLVAVAAVLCLSGGHAWSQTAAAAPGPPLGAAPRCPAPPPPPGDDQRPPPVDAQPTLPSCVDPQTRLSHCSRPVLGRYNADVAAYNAQLTARATAVHHFVDSLNDWMREAQAYGLCEVNVLNAEDAAANGR